MKDSIGILVFFMAGFLCGLFQLLPEYRMHFDGVTCTLYLLIFFVGIGVGSNTVVWQMIRRVHFKILFVPLAVIVGTFFGVALVSPFISDISLSEALAIGSGFGYYSLSSVLISQMHSELLGIIALVSNLMREILTLILSPVLFRLFGCLAPIAAGGATSMDVTLPVITKVAGKEYTVVSIFNGVILSILVPILVPLLLR